MVSTIAPGPFVAASAGTDARSAGMDFVYMA